MDWTNELKQLETELRTLPIHALSVEKHQEIFQVIQETVHHQQNHKRYRKVFISSVLSAACLAITMLVVIVYNHHSVINNTNTVVPGLGRVQKGAIFTFPVVGTSQNWAIELVPSHVTSPASTPEKPRYDFILRYNGSAAPKDVVLEEHGIGIWKPDGTVIPSDVVKLGTVNYSWQDVYSNFSILPKVSELSFKISWIERGKSYTEQITIPRQ